MVKHACWVEYDKHSGLKDYVVCSNCNAMVRKESVDPMKVNCPVHYCMKCGAEMDNVVYSGHEEAKKKRWWEQCEINYEKP